jgi:hypothetical protein
MEVACHINGQVILKPVNLTNTERFNMECHPSIEGFNCNFHEKDIHLDEPNWKMLNFKTEQVFKHFYRSCIRLEKSTWMLAGQQAIEKHQHFHILPTSPP